MWTGHTKMPCKSNLLCQTIINFASRKVALAGNSISDRIIHHPTFPIIYKYASYHPTRLRAPVALGCKLCCRPNQ